MSVRDDLVKIFREQQQKYCYYVIALCVAAIGFSVHKTMGLSISKSQIPLGIAVLSWGFSVWCGLRYLGLMTASLFTNIGLVDVQEGKSEITGRDPAKIKIGVETLTRSLDETSNKTMRLASWQDKLFFIGIICFVGWRIWEMINVTN